MGIQITYYKSKLLSFHLTLLLSSNSFKFHLLQAHPYKGNNRHYFQIIRPFELLASFDMFTWKKHIFLLSPIYSFKYPWVVTFQNPPGLSVVLRFQVRTFLLLFLIICYNILHISYMWWLFYVGSYLHIFIEWFLLIPKNLSWICKAYTNSSLSMANGFGGPWSHWYCSTWVRKTLEYLMPAIVHVNSQPKLCGYYICLLSLR